MQSRRRDRNKPIHTETCLKVQDRDCVRNKNKYLNIRDRHTGQENLSVSQIYF